MSTVNNEIEANQTKNNEIGGANNKEILVKLVALRKGFLEERKQKEELKAENDKLREQNIMKQEQISKLKEELKDFRENSTKPFSRFFKNILDKNEFEDIQEKDDKDKAIDSLDQKRLILEEKVRNLEENIQKLEQEKKDVITENEKLKKELKNEKEKNINNIKKLEEEYNINMNKIKNDNDEKEKLISDYIHRLQLKEDDLKSFESQKRENIKEMTSMRETVKQNEENVKKIKEQNTLIQNENQKLINVNLSQAKTIEDLKFEMNQYKLIIEDLTPLQSNYLFRGVVLPNKTGNNNNNNIITSNDNKKIELSFGKFKNCIYMKLDDDQELNLVEKQVVDILANKTNPGQIKIILKFKKQIKEIICQFTKKEGKYIKIFFNKFKNGNKVDEEIIGMAFGNYY